MNFMRFDLYMKDARNCFFLPCFISVMGRFCTPSALIVDKVYRRFLILKWHLPRNAEGQLTDGSDWLHVPTEAS
jgi:hypothetical protein